jgi:hypothetical protein
MEIYDNTLSQLTAATSVNNLNIVWSSSGRTTAEIVQNNAGYYLSSGYTCNYPAVYSVCSGNCVTYEYCYAPGISPTPTRSATPTPTASVTSTQTPTQTSTQTPTPTRTAVATPTPTAACYFFVVSADDGTGDRNAYDFDYVNCAGDTVNSSVVNTTSRTVCAKPGSITSASPYITVGDQGAACGGEPTPTPTQTPTKTPTPTRTPTGTPTPTPLCYFYTNSSGNNWMGDWVDCDGTTHFAENVPDGSSICARPTPFTLSGVDLIQGSACSGPPPTPSSTPESTPASTPTSTPAAAGSFTVRNTSGSGQIDDVTTTGGAYFYFFNTGFFPLTSGQEGVGGGASLTGAPIFVTISNFSSSSCLVLYINSSINDSITVTGNGTYTFSNKTFTTSDVVLIDYDSSSC